VIFWNAAIDVEIADELFVAKGLMIKERNYLEIYKYENWSDRSIPVFVNGEAFRPTELTMTSGRTQVCLRVSQMPPQRDCALAHAGLHPRCRGPASEMPAAMCAQPPPLLSEADLIQMMNRHGIGTDATIASHITTIQDREYAGTAARHLWYCACRRQCPYGIMALYRRDRRPLKDSL